MSEKVYRKVEREPSHAGRILKSGFLDVYGLRIETVANLLGISRGHMSRIINGHNPITLDLAIRLSVLTQTSASQWLAIQAKYDAYKLEQEQTFKQYQETITEWATIALALPPDERNHDQTIQQLTADATFLAKQFSSRKTPQHHREQVSV